MTICFATEAEARLEETKRHVEDCATKVVVKSTSDLKREIRTEPRIRTILTYISIYCEFSFLIRSISMQLTGSTRS